MFLEKSMTIGFHFIKHVDHTGKTNLNLMECQKFLDISQRKTGLQF